jgi:nitroreductase
MQFDDVVLGRRSICGFKPDPVPKALTREVIELAVRTPSSLNTHLGVSMWSRGLGRVVNSQGIMESPVVREHAARPDDQVVMISIAMAGRTRPSRRKPWCRRASRSTRRGCLWGLRSR